MKHQLPKITDFRASLFSKNNERDQNRYNSTDVGYGVLNRTLMFDDGPFTSPKDGSMNFNISSLSRQVSRSAFLGDGRCGEGPDSSEATAVAKQEIYACVVRPFRISLQLASSSPKSLRCIESALKHSIERGRRNSPLRLHLRWRRRAPSSCFRVPS